MQIDTLLHLFECAEIGCADIHKLIEMISIANKNFNYYYYLTNI